MTFNVTTISRNLRKGLLQYDPMRALPGLAPAELPLSEAPSYGRMPLYNADLQVAGFPAEVTNFADAIRKADGIIIVTPEL